MSTTRSSPLALVTGTSSGIGEAVALELLRRGWRVVGLARRAGALDDPSYTHLPLDLADLAALPDRVDAAIGPMLVEGTVSRLALVNNANVSSGAGISPYPGLATYGGTKAALRMAGMVLAAEVEMAERSQGVRRDVAILSYGPGPVDTPMQAMARSAPVETFPLREPGPAS